MPFYFLYKGYLEIVWKDLSIIRHFLCIRKSPLDSEVAQVIMIKSNVNL